MEMTQIRVIRNDDSDAFSTWATDEGTVGIGLDTDADGLMTTFTVEQAQRIMIQLGAVLASVTNDLGDDA